MHRVQKLGVFFAPRAGVASVLGQPPEHRTQRSPVHTGPVGSPAAFAGRWACALQARAMRQSLCGKRRNPGIDSLRRTLRSLRIIGTKLASQVDPKAYLQGMKIEDMLSKSVSLIHFRHVSSGLHLYSRPGWQMFLFLLKIAITGFLLEESVHGAEDKGSEELPSSSH